jgi:hypothetical protein
MIRNQAVGVNQPASAPPRSSAAVTAPTCLSALCLAVLLTWAGHVSADDSKRFRYVHDRSGRVIGTIERLGNGSERVRAHDGRYLGTADRSGTRDASGRIVSPEKVPGLLLPRAGDEGGRPGN